MKTLEKQEKKIMLGKKLIYQDLEKEFTTSDNTFFSRFDRLSVQDMNELRRSLGKVSRRTVLVKHTLAKKILAKIQLADAVCFLEGSTLVTLGAQEPQLVSKALVDFVKGHENLELKGMVLGGEIYEASFVKELARLPSRKEILTQVAIRMKSPITGFVMTLQGLLQSFVIVLNEIQKKRAQGAPETQPA